MNGEKSEFGYGTPEMSETRSFPYPISLPLSFSNSIFFHFSSSNKTRTKILGWVIFGKFLLRNLHDAVMKIVIFPAILHEKSSMRYHVLVPQWCAYKLLN